MASVSSLKGVKVLPKPVLAELKETYTISQEEFNFYRTNGFLVIKELIDFASLYTYKQRFIQICNGVVPQGNMNVVKEPSLRKLNLKPEDYINKIQEILYDDVFVTYAEHPRMLHVLSQLIGDDIIGVNSMIINKPPGTGRHPPHQDLFYFPFRPADKIIGAWTAVDHVTVDNGCLYVIPGSHLKETLYPHGVKPEEYKLYHGIVDEEGLAPTDQRIHLEMSPGDTVFFHPYLVHGSGPNVSKNYRKAITFHFANSHCYYIDLKGTVQENCASDVEQELFKKRGYNLKYADAWKMKSRLIKGVRASL